MTRELTLKQQEVRDLIVLGKSNKEIALDLGVGRRTIEEHRKAVYKKLGVRNAVQLTRKTLGAD